MKAPNGPFRAAASAVLLAGLLSRGRAEAATIVVNDPSDALHDPGCATTGTGTCTLRDAITFANANAGADVVHFDIPGGGVQTIQPASDLPDVSEALTIDGYTQPGATPNTNGPGLADNAVFGIELAGGGGAATGLHLVGGSCAVRGLVVNRFATGILLDSAEGDTVAGNFVGTDPAGTSALGNQIGVWVRGSPNAVIGGTAPASRNVISGNTSGGVILQTTGNTVQGNFIGIDATGTAALANASPGISIVADDNTVGGNAMGAGNVVSGNLQSGILLSGSSGHLLQGNLIGTDAAGEDPVPNGGPGIVITSGAGGALIGGTSPGSGNVIAFNAQGGVKILSGTATTLEENAIFDNGALGIDLGGDGPTVNDHCDTDSGVNDLQNFPTITSVVSDASTTTVDGTLDAVSNTSFRVEFFSNAACDGSGFGGGQVFLGSSTVSTDGTCSATFHVVLPVAISASDFVTATATDPAGNTSEFSPCFPEPAIVLTPQALAVDAGGDGVLEPGETISVAPSWRNEGAGDVAGLTGTGSGFTGPSGPTYAIPDAAASYGTLAAGQTAACADCYALSLSAPASRPATHWDAIFTETLSVSSVSPKIWTLHVGDSFSDVPRSNPFYTKIETIFHHGVAAGCGGSSYCPGDKVTRAQMALFIARGLAGGGAFLPASGMVGSNAYQCGPGGTSLFSDIDPADIACKAVHYLASQNVVAGCGGSQYCPVPNVTRAEMAIFIAKAIVAPGGGPAVPQTYGPDPGTGRSYSCETASPNLHFTDVFPSDSFCRHAHFLWATGVIAGCAADQYCPTPQVGRDEMAKFLANAFGLQLYGP